MSALSDRLQKDLVAGMKARDSLRVSVLRLVKSAMKNKEIELSRALTEEEELGVLATLVKQRNESIETYERAGRADLADKEKAERELLRTYLPEEVTPEEVERVVSEVVSDLGASSPKEMGAVMKEALARLRATGKTVDGKAVNAVVRAKLS